MMAAWKRVARLEAGMSDIKATLARFEPVLGQVSRDLTDNRSKGLPDLKALVAKLDGRVSQLEISAAKLDGRVSQFPSTVQLLGFVLAVPAIAGVTRFITGS